MIDDEFVPRSRPRQDGLYECGYAAAMAGRPYAPLPSWVPAQKWAYSSGYNLAKSIVLAKERRDREYETPPL